MRTLAAFLLAACVAACSLPGPREPDRYFILEAGPAPAAARSGPSVAVEPTTVAGFYDTQDIAFSREPGTRAYYQFNHWTERPQRAIHRLLAGRLEGTGPEGALRLETRLEEIYHDAAQAPGTAHITIAAELVDSRRRAVLARRTFSRSAPAASHDAPGAVRGFNQALAAVLGDIEAWVAAEARK
jgi:ABC-type uncharacterized transport system auxiliary subunit